ncbi:hypothetical protein [Mycoplasma sp. P36-A1]|uniref:hypothetical protein n=1 Tax=Mycoplasma sp. P36-A1 TaxID=3252900 RepID=UPI003C2DD088
MNNNKNIFDRLKVFETVKVLVNYYSYKEVIINKVDGIFLENRASEWTLIRVSEKKFATVEEFNADLELMRKVSAQYKRVSNMDNIKILCIYFGGTVASEVENITSIVIENSDNLSQNPIIEKAFPKLLDVNLDQIDGIIQMQKDNVSTKPAAGMLADKVVLKTMKELNEKTKFTRYFVILFMIINMAAIFYFDNVSAFLTNTSYYSVFFEQFNQYYRLFSSVFLNSNILYIVCFIFFFFRYNTYIELELGTKKTIMLYGISLVMVILTMMFFIKGIVVAGSFPILCILAGAYVGIASLPEKRKFLFANMFNIMMVLLMIMLISTMNYINLPAGIVGFLTAVACVYALNLNKEAINKAYLATFAVIAIAIAGLSFIPENILVRDKTFEESYITAIKSKDKTKASQLSDKLNTYYEKIGLVEYE